MNPLQPASVTDEEIEANVNAMLEQWERGDVTLRSVLPGVTRRGDVVEAIRNLLTTERSGVEYWLNETYQVAMRPIGTDGDYHLSIKRRDKQPIHDWRDLQAIKNQLLGEECEAIELYPAESRRVDTANQYHLWGTKDPAFRFPCGFATRAVSDHTIGKSVNRKL